MRMISERISDIKERNNDKMVKKIGCRNPFIILVLCAIMVSFAIGCSSGKTSGSSETKKASSAVQSSLVTAITSTSESKPASQASSTAAEQSKPSSTVQQQNEPSTASQQPASSVAAQQQPEPSKNQVASSGAAFVQQQAQNSEPISNTYILNTNSKVFHYPTCPSVGKMKEKNKQTFTGSREEAISNGFKPCGNCKP